MRTILLHLLPASLYAGLGVFFWRTCMTRGSALEPRRECMSTRERLLLLGAIVAHGAALHLAIFPGSEMRFGFGVAVSLMVWLAVCFYWVETLYTRLDGLHAAVMPAGAIGSLVPMLFPGDHVLANAGIAYFGGGHNLAEAHRPLWIEKNGLKIAVLGYNEFKPRAFEAGANWPGVAWSEDDLVIAGIRAAKAAGADLVIPFMHWGWEKETQPTERQKVFARKMIDEGAALVVGSHPHVTQGAEIYKDKPIVYSLGNFVFDGFDYPEAQRGWLLRLKLDKSGVVFWETLPAQIDDAGKPWPASGAFTPCGRGGEELVLACQQNP